MSSSGQDFADIPHSFDSVAHQVERGLNSLKRNSNYIRKVCDAKIAYHAQVQKLSRAETVSPVKDEHGNMSRFNKSFEAMTAMFNSLAEKENMMGLVVIKEVVDQLDAAIESTNVTRKVILQEEKKATAALRAMYETKTKQRAALLKAIDELKAEKERERLAAVAPPTSWQDKAKAKVAATLKKDPEKMRKDIYDMAVAYKECVKDANLQQAKYYKEELPAIMAKMQRLESTRLATMETAFNRLVQAQTSSYEKCLEDCGSWKKTLELMDKNADIAEFVDGVIILNGSALPPLQFSYDIVVSPDDIKANRLEGVPEKSVFNKTLASLMILQQATHPVLDVPVTLHKLVEVIRLKGGLAREGIFRNPPRQEELEENRKLLEAGADVGSLKFSDVDVPASLLKAWLRDLAEPIVPHEKFKEAIDISQLPNYTNAQIKAFVKTWPAINQRVFEVLADLLDELSSAANAPYTRMTLTSLGVVFAPCVMKNPSEDVLELMNSSKFEARFVGIALAAVMDREEVWKTALAEKQANEAKQKAKLDQLAKEREEAFAALQAEQEKASKETRTIKEDVAFERLLLERDSEQKSFDTERAKSAMEEERRLRREQRRKEDAEIAQKLASPEGRAEAERRDAEKKEQERKEAEERQKREQEKRDAERREAERLEQERQLQEAIKEAEKREAELLRQAEQAKLEALKAEVARLETLAKEDAAKRQDKPAEPPTPKASPPPPPAAATPTSKPESKTEPKSDPKAKMPAEEGAKEASGKDKKAVDAAESGGKEKKMKKPPPPAPKAEIEKSAPSTAAPLEGDKLQEAEQHEASSADLVHVSRPSASAHRKKPSPPQFHSPEVGSGDNAVDSTEHTAEAPASEAKAAPPDSAAESKKQPEEKERVTPDSPSAKKEEKGDEPASPAYVVPPTASKEELLAKDADDDAMNKYKSALMPSSAKPFDADNPSKVVLNALILCVSDRPDVVLPVSELETTKFVLKEGVNFSIGMRFYVQHDITSCIQWQNDIVRMKVGVGKKTVRLGARAPQTDPYTFFLPEEAAPSGMMGRGVYSCTAKLFDDDVAYGTYKYSFEVKRDWD